jgi:catechol 2,3-dioxygenase-like lactoylglutathione lyase family enzyme
VEHVGIVVDDLAAATAFFVELGLKLQGDGRNRLKNPLASSVAAR